MVHKSEHFLFLLYMLLLFANWQTNKEEYSVLTSTSKANMVLTRGRTIRETRNQASLGVQGISSKNSAKNCGG